jgi:hypothetical protein
MRASALSQLSQDNSTDSGKLGPACASLTFHDNRGWDRWDLAADGVGVREEWCGVGWGGVEDRRDEYRRQPSQLSHTYPRSPYFSRSRAFRVLQRFARSPYAIYRLDSGSAILLRGIIAGCIARAHTSRISAGPISLFERPRNGMQEGEWAYLRGSLEDRALVKISLAPPPPPPPPRRPPASSRRIYRARSLSPRRSRTSDHIVTI